MARVAAEPTNLEKRETNTKHASTWLDAGGWKKEPSPGNGAPLIDEQGNEIATVSTATIRTAEHRRHRRRNRVLKIRSGSATMSLIERP